MTLKLPLKQDSSSYQIWQPPEWQVIWLGRRRLCTRRQPRSVRGFMCMHVHTCTNKKRGLCVFFFLVALVKLQLWIIHSDWIKVTLWFKETFKYPVLLNIILCILSAFTLQTFTYTFCISLVTYTVISFGVGRAWHKVLAGSEVYLTYKTCKGLWKHYLRGRRGQRRVRVMYFFSFCWRESSQ